ncbi:MAG TPA: hypothetical protein VFJ74_15130 [Gemmatimonadaceae bacterium]|nr:hypothetical protein [Gemmatimonadaceae bacterium]
MRTGSRLVTRRPLRAAGAAAVALLAASAALGACGGGDALAPGALVQGRSGGATGGAANRASASALVGDWFRLVYFTDSTGVTTSETTWEFRADSTATRSVVARGLTTGAASGVSTGALWSVSGTTLSITLLPAGVTDTTGRTTPGNPPFGTNPGTGDTTATTRPTTIAFTFRIDSTTATDGTRTLYLGGQPFVFVGPPGSINTTTR